MKIAVWIEGYAAGGADWSLIDLVTSWPDKADRFVIFVNQTHEGYDLIRDKTKGRAEIRSFSSIKETVDVASRRTRTRSLYSSSRFFKTALWGLITPVSFFSYWRCLGPGKYDVLMINNGGYPGGSSGFLAAIAARLRGIPKRLMIVRNYPRRDLVDSRLFGLLRLVVRTTLQKIVAVSNSLKGSLLADARIPEAMLVRIYNGVEFASKCPPDGADMGFAQLHNGVEGGRVGVIGTLEPRKGHDILFRSWATTVAQFPAARLYVIGAVSSDPANRMRLQNLARALGIEASIVWIDFVKEIGAVYRLLDIVVVASREYESFGRTVIEAMAFRKLVIGSRLGGVAELIENGKDGYLFESEDDAALAALLIQAIGSADDRIGMGVAGERKYRKYFTADIMANNYCELVKTL